MRTATGSAITLAQTARAALEKAIQSGSASKMDPADSAKVMASAMALRRGSATAAMAMALLAIL
jgi:hypothetical protein